MAAKLCHDRGTNSNGIENLFSALWLFSAVGPKVQKINFTHPGRKTYKIEQIVSLLIKSIAYNTEFSILAQKSVNSTGEVRPGDSKL